MILLAVCLGLTVALALVLALVLPRRVARLVAAELAAEQSRNDARDRAAKAKLQEASAAEAAVLVASLRALLDEHRHGRHAGPPDPEVSSLAPPWTGRTRGVLPRHDPDDFGQPSSHPASPPLETTRLPDRVPASRLRPTPLGFASLKAPVQPDPSLLAARLGPRPAHDTSWHAARTMPSMAAVHVPQSRPPPPVSVETYPRKLP